MASRTSRKMKMSGSPPSERDGLRCALAWSAEQAVRDVRTIEEVSRSFNVSLLDEQVVLDHFHTTNQEPR